MIETCVFETERLAVAPWHQAVLPERRTLAHVVAGMLTPRTTATLPDDWHGSFSDERARNWITEQDLEGTNLLVSDRRVGEPVGLMFLSEIEESFGTLELRLGYLIQESSWRRGFASELVEGLIEWAEATGGIDSLVGGVALDNLASAKVLMNNGFTAQPTPNDATEQFFTLRL